MAEAILYNVAATIIENLGSATLGRDLGLLFGADDELRRLNDTVSAIGSLLLDAEEKQDTNPQVKDWIQKLQDAFYSADDLVDDFCTEATWRRVTFGGGDSTFKKVLIFFSTSNQIAFTLGIGGRVKKVRERLDEIKDSKSFYLIQRLEDKTCVPSTSRESCSFIGDEEVIGRGKDKSAIIERLLSNDSQFEVVPIVGIGGLGKTTLAQLVFNDQSVRLREQFTLRIWVYVSEVFDLKLILEKIVKSITQQSPGDLELEQFQILLQREIAGKRFLLVLDDMCDVDSEKWFNLERLLRCGEKGSRVLVTTRNEMVAEITTQSQSQSQSQTVLKPYKLSGLDQASSQELFKRAAFGRGPEPEDQKFADMGTEILEKCRGVPLAIKTLGSVLFVNRREVDWRSIKENNLWNIPQGEHGILPVLKISYNSLPSRLKHCFAYCRLFPKDRELDVQRLIRLWVAQGFVEPSDDQTQCLEEVGYGYFMDLLRRSFFQEPVFDEWGNVKRCKIHGLMHDLAAFVAGPGSVMIDRGTGSLGEKTRHLSFDLKFDGPWDVPEPLLKKNPNLRTFISPRQSAWNSLRCLDRDAVLLNLVTLRTLDLKALGIEELPSSLGDLKHLRYLDLSQNKFKLLPSSMRRLQNLQTLILSNCRELIRLPRDTRRLVSLRYLHLKGCRSLTYMPGGLRELTSLRSLDRFLVADKNDVASSQAGKLGELGKLNDLSADLAIENLGHGKSAATEAEAANLKDKKHLHSLVLFWKSGSESSDNERGTDEVSLDYLQPHSNVKALKVVNYTGSKFASWLSSLNSLVKLELLSYKKCHHLPPLDELPCLKELTLYELTALEYISDEPTSLSAPERPFFPSLMSLKIRFCAKLKGWSRTTTTSVFPRLHDLSIRNCPQFNTMPLFPFLSCLELMDTSFKPLQQTMIMEMKIRNSYSPLCELKNLSISQIKDIESFPEEIRNLTSLQSLGIVGCANLTSLPEVIENLSSLESLRICECPKMESLPVGMRRLSGLKLLKIENCPILYQRCEKDIGGDWINICHIPRIETD